MTFTEKIDVLELLINLLQEHEQELDSLVEKLEIVNQTIKQSHIHEQQILYEGTLLEDRSYREILIVDDDENLVNTFKLILEDVGFNVDTSLTGLGALKQLEKKTYDLVILDLNLPDMLGYQIAEEMETMGYPTEYIYITGYSSLRDDLDSQYNASEILMKPVEPEKLVEVSTKHINKVKLGNT